MKKFFIPLLLSALVLAACSSNSTSPVSTAGDTAGSITPPKEEPKKIETFVSFKVDGKEIRLDSLTELTFLADSENYGEKGELTIMFGSSNGSASKEGQTLGLTIPGKTTGKFIAEQGREPFIDPLMQYGITNSQDKSDISFSSTTLTTGDGTMIEITRFDKEQIAGTFSGLLSETNPTGYNLNNKVNISAGDFSIDMSKHKIEEI